MQRVIPAGALVGRDSEMALLTGLIKELARGRGGSVLIEGEPGIGKSALVRTAVTEAPEAGCEVFWGAGDELGQALPLLPFLDGLRVREPSANPRRKTIVRLLRGEDAADRGTDVPAVLAEQLLALVAEQCAVRPIILVVDDLQWADQASVTLWGRLARSARQVPLLLVGTMRPVPQRDDLMALRRAAGDAARLQLTGLTETAVADLVAALAGGKPGGNLLRLTDGAAGNPLYVTELVAALTRSSSLTITEAGAAELAGGSAPGSLSAAIADRLGFVDGAVREVLRAAALLGTDFAVRDLGIVLGRGVADLIPAVDEACAAGVLAESGSGLGFRHPLIRAALYDEMPTPVRAAWHRDAGRALAEAGAPADRVARQMLRAVGGPGATEPMDEWMLTWLVRSADPLIGQAPRVAAELLSRAVARSPAGSAQHDWLASRLADALYRIGDRQRPNRWRTAPLSTPPSPIVLVDLHWTLAQCRMRAGESAESLASAGPGAGLARDLGPAPRPAARARRADAQLPRRGREGRPGRRHCAGGGVGGGRQLGHGLGAARAGAGDRGAGAYDRRAAAIRPGADRDRGRSGADRPAAAAADQQGRRAGQSRPVRGGTDRGRAGTAARRARSARRSGWRRRTAPWASCSSRTGRWDDALAEVESLPENLKEPAAACIDLGIAAVISFHRGETGAARRHLAAAVPHATRIGHRLIGRLAVARSLDREQDGALPEALAALTEAFDDSTEQLEETEDLLADAVRLAAETGDLSTAQTLAGHAETLAGESEIPHRQANAMYCRGLLDHDGPRLLMAAERYEAASRPLPRAKALEAAAGYFVDADDRVQARAAFTTAVEVYTALGAAADAARLQATFRAHGIRRGPHAKHRRAQSGWDSLTATEIKIAAFVEEGLSNPEIAARLLLSRRTVATHVSHILKKLNVNSRIDIARESALRTIPPK